MGRTRPPPLTDRSVRKAAKTPGDILDGATPGLYLITGPHGRQRWMFRHINPRTRKPTEIGIGHLPNVDLAKARASVWEKRHWLRQGIDPQEVKRLSLKQTKTFADVAAMWIEKRKLRWRGNSSLRDVTNIIEVHAKPFAHMGTAHITTDIIEQALTPLWKTHPKQMQRALAVWKSIFDFAQANGFDIPRANPARWKDVLEHRLPIPRNGDKKHFAAIPYKELPAVMQLVRQRQRDGTGAACIEFVVLTACRSNEVLGAQWSEFDFENRIWVVPAWRMKAGIMHRVPLSDRSMQILVQQKECSMGGPFVFTGYSQKPLSPGTMYGVLQNIVPGATVHGFRSSFRDWAGDMTTYPREVIEECLAHKVGNKVEQSYRRGDALDKRRALMAEWAAYIG